MIEHSPFQPNWISPPGDTVADILGEKKLLLTEFAAQIGYSVDYTNGLIRGMLPITSKVAQQLELVLGVSATFWTNRERQYREDVARLSSSTEESWLKELPVKDMINFGWIRPVHHTAEKLVECLRFFDVASATRWRESYHNVLEATSFRKSPSFDSHPGAVAAWLRQGEIESTLVDCKHWDAKRFRDTLPEIRSLTRKRDPQIFVPKLQRLCAECGVAVVIVRAPTGCRASGATLFLSPHKALLLLSFRFLSDDHFWFTFFHEAGHLLLHSKKALFLEGFDRSSLKEEQEANEFAANALIPEEFHQGLSELPLNGREVIRFAKVVGVSPGVIVGQLQHRGLVSPKQLNNLKTRYSWASET
ncbi:MAG: ImmA/IrrE family metallo-endopeptidase [Desulforhabdus sp.]|jgi:plasmid maintenance system antidote protein VapI|nr:ImmA/IrrE family metallo-endopeptidase [Desulforhabdus sp.]